MTINAEIEAPEISGIAQIHERILLRWLAGRVFDAVADCSGVDSSLEKLAAYRDIFDATTYLTAALTMTSRSARFRAEMRSGGFLGMSMISVENAGCGAGDIYVGYDDDAYIIAVKVAGLCHVEESTSSKKHAREIYVRSILALVDDLAASR